jgi:hypothetical protein
MRKKCGALAVRRAKALPVPYAIRLILFIVVADVVVFFAGYRLRHYGPWVLVGIVALAIYLTVVVGRRVLKREKL